MIKSALVNSTNALGSGKWGVHATSRDVIHKACLEQWSRTNMLSIDMG